MSPIKNKVSAFSIAVFITPHGFGHAARASAVMIELNQLLPGIIFHIYTTVPQWFFTDSHLARFVYHSLPTDVGLAQHNAMSEDLPGTIRLLKDFLPFQPSMVQSLATEVQSNGCRLVLCDIAPLGIAVARRAGIPSLLQENFTWDWIYAGYPTYQEQITPYIHILADWFSMANYHIQTTPACKVDTHFPMVSPVSRPIHQSRAEIRQSLQVDADIPIALVTMGGIEKYDVEMNIFASRKDVLFVIPGAAHVPVRENNLILLPHHHGIYHPDLVNACDVVVGKLGYSTLAECYAAGVSFAFIPRKQFPESAPLTQFALSTMHAEVIDENDYASGEWLNQIPALLSQPRDTHNRVNGAGEIARFIRDRLLLSE